MPPSQELPYLKDGRYLVSYSHYLGGGSYAKVYLGYDLHENRKEVAVKVMNLKGFSASARQSLMKEVEALEVVSKRNPIHIVRLFAQEVCS